MLTLAIPIKLKLDEWKLQEDEQSVNWSYEISKNFIRFEHDSLGLLKNCDPMMISTNENGAWLGPIRVI